MPEFTNNPQQYLQTLELHKRDLVKAKSHKGQKPTASQRRSRSRLEEEFGHNALRDTIRASSHTIRQAFVGEA